MGIGNPFNVAKVFDFIGDLADGIVPTTDGMAELIQLGKNCSSTERRAEKAERELIKIKLLRYMANHIGEEMEAFITGVENFGMLLTGATLTVGLATIHEALAKVPQLLSTQAIVRSGLLTAEFLKRRGIARPRIAVAGLNPHAGENGAFGDEEIRIIAPAIQELNASATAIFTGPAVPDAIFRDAARGHFDAVLAMYHDQGLIPLKLLDFDNAVNVTLGLPKPRTSPDHGTAFAIAGKNQADPSSMIAAIRLACELA